MKKRSDAQVSEPMQDLTTKHRPRSFDDVVGMVGTVEGLKSVVETGSARAFLFHGPSGCGKTTLARNIAWAKGCTNPDEIDAATHTGVDAMREIASATAFRPLTGGAKVLIIDECHMLSKGAWNSLLKSIEEPPPGVYWCFCTTEPEKVPATIRTRCAVFEVRPLKRDELEGLLQSVVDAEGVEVAGEVLRLCAEKADGSPRNALRLLAALWEFETRADAVQVLGEVQTDGTESIELCRLLANFPGMKGWPQAAKIIEGLIESEIEPETVRLQVLAYMSKVALGAKKPEAAEGALAIMECFEEPFSRAGAKYAPLVLAVGLALRG